MIMNKSIHMVLLFASLLMLSGCEKMLEEKSDKKLSTPSTLADFRALLNNPALNHNFCSLGEASGDEYYLTDEDFNGLYYESDKRLYTWKPDYVSRDLSSAGNEWYFCYSAIYIANAVLSGLGENHLSGQQADELRGQALAFRAGRYLDAVQIWAPAYDGETAGRDPGMVLRLDPDMNIPSVRSTVRETYNQILKDLNEAVLLLPNTTAAPTLPTGAAGYGLLARAYLNMGDYANALENAKKALASKNVLIDFSKLDINADFPIPAVSQTSAEIVFLNRMFYSELVGNPEVAKISPALYGLYKDGDLRKQIYYRENQGHILFKGTHTGHIGLITGLTTGELYLIVAECYARLNNLTEAEKALNTLLEARWDKKLFRPYRFKDQSAALNIILEERRKELVFRGLRWADIKRLNRDGAEIELTRKVNGESFGLPPNDKKFAIALPEEVVEIGNVQ